MLMFIGLPLRPNFLREFRRCVEICARKIQNKWSCDDGHFDDQEFIVKANDSRNLEAGDLSDASISKA